MMSSDQDWDRCPYRDEIRAGMDLDNIDGRPEPEDYMVSPTGPLGSRYSVAVIDGKHLGDCKDWEQVEYLIRSRMDSEQVFPNVWWQSDHGNIWQIRVDGTEIRDPREPTD